MAAPTRTPRLHSLTALRWAAALGIFGYHVRFLLTARDGLGWVGGLLVPTRNGVSLFFVLSGFVLAWSARPGERARGFYRRRVARIVPVYMVALGVGAAVTVAEGHGIGPLAGATTPTLTQSWVPDEDVFHAVNPPAWSLSVEAFCYAAFPLLLPPLARLGRRGRRALLGGAVALVTAWEVAGGLHLFAGLSYWLVTVLPVARLPEFVVGMLVALDGRDGYWPRVRARAALRWTLAVCAGVALLSLAFDAPARTATTASVTLLPFALLLAALARRDVAGASVVSVRWVRWGERSYAFYLVHFSVLRLFQLLHPDDVGATLPAVGWVLVLLAGSMLAAAVLHDLVERPLERRLRGDAPRRPLPPEDPSAPYPDEPVSAAARNATEGAVARPL